MIDDSLNSIELAVVRWSAWAPGLTGVVDWNRSAAGTPKPSLSETPPEKPDVSFVPALLRRRLSSLSRMAFHVAAECYDNEAPPDAYVYCSRYGEYERSFEILSGLARQEAVSPAAFSHSVHNTSASLFSICQKDPTSYTALAAGAATLESAFLESWTLLSSQEACRVLLVFHDEPLPPLYDGQETNVTEKCALAMILQPCEGAPTASRLRLSWQGRVAAPSMPREANDPALRVLRLLINGRDSYTNNADRLVWNWARHAGAA